MFSSLGARRFTILNREHIATVQLLFVATARVLQGPLISLYNRLSPWS